MINSSLRPVSVGHLLSPRPLAKGSPTGAVVNTHTNTTVLACVLTTHSKTDTKKQMENQNFPIIGERNLTLRWLPPSSAESLTFLVSPFLMATTIRLRSPSTSGSRPLGKILSMPRTQSPCPTRLTGYMHD